VWDENVPGFLHTREQAKVYLLGHLRHVRETKAMLEKSGELSKENLRNVELCLWDEDGSHIRLERDVVGVKNSSTT